MSQSTQQLFDDIAQFIAASRALIDQGAYMALSGLDDQVQALCQEVLQLSQAERLRYADRLQFLLAELQSLGETMALQRDRVGDEIREIPQHKKASVAYRTADSRDDFGKRDEEPE